MEGQMLPVKEWYWDPKRNEQIFITDQLNNTKEVKMGWERVFAIIAVMVAEEAIRQCISKDED
jgi:hypothetical protein